MLKDFIILVKVLGFTVMIAAVLFAGVWIGYILMYVGAVMFIGFIVYVVTSTEEEDKPKSDDYLH